VDTPRFLCDEMLGRLARYLRAAGYDAALAHDGAPDRDLLLQAAQERRLFLTCDRGIAEHKAARDRALILPRGTLDALARELARNAGVDWQHAPFTRCLVDNTPLARLAAERVSNLPADVVAENARTCPTCARIYWAGSHYRRMQQRLAGWARGEFHL